MIAIESGDYAMTIDPTCGGSVRSLRWRGRDILRAATEPNILASASFALLPFCNRIVGNHFVFEGRSLRFSPNHPSDLNEPILHGFGWTSEWESVAVEPTRAVLGLDHPPGEWPWRFTARQEFALGHDGVKMSLALTNRADSPMPAGLGFHPYFARDDATTLHGLHTGELRHDGNLDCRADAVDWWRGKPVDSRIVDTTYAHREGGLIVAWPREGMAMMIRPSRELPNTHIYVPSDADFFCAEPVSHLPNAINTAPAGTGMRVLAPGESWTVSMQLRAYALPLP